MTQERGPSPSFSWRIKFSGKDLIKMGIWRHKCDSGLEQWRGLVEIYAMKPQVTVEITE